MQTSYDADSIPVHDEGYTSKLCDVYNMKFTFDVNDNSEIDEPVVDDEPSAVTDMMILPYDPMGDTDDSSSNPGTPKPYDDNSIEVSSFDDFFWPVLLGVLLVFLLIAFGVACCLVSNNRRKQLKTDDNRETMETSANLRSTSSDKWFQQQTYLTNFSTSHHPLRATRSIDQLRKLTSEPHAGPRDQRSRTDILEPMLQTDPIPASQMVGVILGDPSASWKYRPGHEVHYQGGQNCSTCRGNQGPSVALRLPSPNDTGCESGSIDSTEQILQYPKHKPGDIVQI